MHFSILKIYFKNHYYSENAKKDERTDSDSGRSVLIAMKTQLIRITSITVMLNNLRRTKDINCIANNYAV